MGPARPGIAHVIIHEVVSKDCVQKMTVDELRDHCFAIINKPLEERYPHLYEKH